MPISSGWPLKPGGVRFFVPRFACEQMAHHPLTQHLYVEGLGYYPEASGHNMVRQSHDDCLVMYCVQGKGWLTTKNTPDNRQRVNEGDLVVLPKGVAHQYQADKDSPWSMYWAHFSGQSSQDYLAPITAIADNYVLSLGIQTKLISDFKNLLSIQKTGYQFSQFIYASNLLAQILAYIPVNLPSTRSGPYINLSSIKSFMEENLSESLDLETLAATANLSKYHFSKRYKEQTGYSPIQHFIHMKIERACYLLDTSDKPITHISDMLGYEDSQYFSRLFKKVIGLSPRDYRKLERG